MFIECFYVRSPHSEVLSLMSVRGFNSWPYATKNKFMHQKLLYKYTNERFARNVLTMYSLFCIDFWKIRVNLARGTINQAGVALHLPILAQCSISIPLKMTKNNDFLTFSGGIEREHWVRMVNVTLFAHYLVHYFEEINWSPFSHCRLNRRLQ